MTSDQVRQLVEAAIGDQWHRSNPHRVNLRTCVIEPRKLTFVTAKDEREVEAWLVLLEGAFGILEKDEPCFDLPLILRGDEREFPGFDHAGTEVDAVRIGSVPLVADGSLDELTNLVAGHSVVDRGRLTDRA